MKLAITHMSVVALDALYFPMDYQYSVEGMHRELLKAYCGFSVARKGRVQSAPEDGDSMSLPQVGAFADRRVPSGLVATGHWGCGVFGGDPFLKVVQDRGETK